MESSHAHVDSLEKITAWKLRVKRENKIHDLHEFRTDPAPLPISFKTSSKEIGGTWRQGKLPKIKAAGASTIVAQDKFEFGSEAVPWVPQSKTIGQLCKHVQPAGPRFNRKNYDSSMYAKDLQDGGLY
uniref:Uncharacterized protein n=1 Tax=Eutreptiella gymnastica TaxID=73025 RepID=A0A7S1JEK8_9EUGL|mmetsp:Transcript_90199/g.156184  ORF Transcript_90199/g.156184 Transcript_90199/m.156184 type:complete len:128 (+) Transcript_90199:92-475(+)